MRFSTELIFAVIAAAGINILHVESTTVTVDVATFNSSSKLKANCGIDVPAEKTKHFLFVQLENVAVGADDDEELSRSEIKQFCYIGHQLSSASGNTTMIEHLITDLKQRKSARIELKKNAPITLETCRAPRRVIDTKLLKRFEQIFISKDAFGNKKRISLNRAEKRDFCSLLETISRNPGMKDEIIGKLALLKKRVDSIVSFDGIKSWAKYIALEKSSGKD